MTRLYLMAGVRTKIRNRINRWRIWRNLKSIPCLQDIKNFKIIYRCPQIDSLFTRHWKRVNFIFLKSDIFATIHRNERERNWCGFFQSLIFSTSPFAYNIYIWGFWFLTHILYFRLSWTIIGHFYILGQYFFLILPLILSYNYLASRDPQKK